MNRSESKREPIEALSAEFIERHRRGEMPKVGEYAARFPELASEIRELFPTILAIEHAKAGQKADPRASVGSLERLGEFHIVREIGRGGMGVVFEAEQQSLQRRVALKVLPRQALADEKQVHRFAREARTAARLHHTNIVPVFGVGEENGLRYYVMQLIDGAGLDSVISELQNLQQHGEVCSTDFATGSSASNGHSCNATSAVEALCNGLVGTEKLCEAKLPTSAQLPSHTATQVNPNRRLLNGKDETADGSSQSAGEWGTHKLGTPYWKSVAVIGAQVADALNYAHGQGMLHRDIKPANLLLDREGTAWVTDFGLAKAVEEKGVTRTGQIVGTLQYVAPEQFDGEQQAGSDQYALGMTLYELLTLTPAFKGSSRLRLIQQITKGTPIRPRSINVNIPRDLETIVLKAIARDPKHRYASAAELRDDLQRFLDDRPVRARRANQIERFWRWCRRNPTVASLVGMVFLSIVMVAVVAAAAYVHTRDALQREEEQRRRASNAYLKTRDALNREEFQRKLADTARIQAANALRREEEQRKLAERTTLLATTALDSVFDELAPNHVIVVAEVTVDSGDKQQIKVPIQPVITRKKAALLERLLVYYNELAAQEAEGFTVRWQAARANRRVGDIQLRFGELDEAQSAYQRSRELYQQLVNESPTTTLISECASVDIELGQVLSRMFKKNSSQSAYRKAVTVLEKAENAATSPHIRYQLARAYFYIHDEPPTPGAFLRKSSGSKRSGKRSGKNRRTENSSLLKAVALLEELVAQHPGTPAYRHLLALSLRKRSSGQGFFAKFDRFSWDRAIDTLEELAADFPSVPDYKFDLSETYALPYLFSTRLPGESTEAAEERLRKALRLSREIAAEHSDMPDYRFSQARIQHQLGDLLNRNNRTDEAEKTYRQSLKLHDSLIERFPFAWHYHIRRARLVDSLAHLLIKQKKHDEAFTLATDSIQPLEQALNEDQEGKSLYMPLAIYRRTLATTLDATGDHQQAAQVRSRTKSFAGWSPPGPFGYRSFRSRFGRQHGMNRTKQR